VIALFYLGGIKLNSKLKKCLSFLIASLLAINFPLSVVGIDTCSEIFTYIEVGDTYNIDKLVANYQELLSGTTEITLPETYNNKPCTTLGMGLFKNNNYFTKIIFPKTISNATGQLFDGCTSIKEVIFECGESFIFMPFSFRDCTSLEKIYVYAETLSMVPSVYAFTNVPSTAIIYVKNETVKNQLTNWPGTIVVDPSLGSEIDYTELDTAITDAEAIDTTKYTEDSVKTLTDAITAGKAVKENADAVQEDVDAAAKSITDAISGLVEASSSVTEYLWTGTFTRKVGVETTSIADGMTVKNNSGNYMTFSGVDLSEMTTPTVEILYTGDSDTVFISTSSWAEIGKGTSTADTVFAIPDSYKSTTSFIVTTNNQSSPYGTITSVRFYDAAASQKTAVATYEVGSENASDVIATLYDDGSFVVSGTGAMADYSSSASKSAPWNQDGNISKITSIEVQNGVTAIGNYAFRNCTTVTSITLAESVTSILNAAFYGCNNENLVVYIKGTVTNAASLCFSKVLGTIYVYDSETFTNVSARAKEANIVLLGMSGLNATIEKAEALDSSIYTADSWAVLEAALVAAKAVAQNANATQNEIDEAINNINNAVDSLAWVSHGPLVGGPWDMTQSKDGSVTAALYQDGTLVISGSGATMNCTSSSYKNTNFCPWYAYASTITGIVVTEGVTGIGNYLFYGYSNIKTLELASSVTSIGNFTFRACELIETITFSNGLTSIGNSAFLGCTSLKELSFPASLTKIDSNAFWNCTSLASVEFDDASNLTSLSDNIFYKCSALKSVKLPSRLTSIGATAFFDCTALETIDIPKGLTSLGWGAFSGCSLTGDITIPAGVTEIPLNTFRDNKSENLNFYVLGEVTSVGSGAFGNCAGKIYVYNETTYQIINALNNGTAEVIYNGKSTSKLEMAIAAGEAVNTFIYTDDSVKILTDAIIAGKSVKENADATQNDIDEATKAITDAIAALVKKSAGSIVYAWTGNWTKQTGLVDAGAATGMTVENTGGGWQMLISNVDISTMVEPVMVVSGNYDKIQIWYGKGVSGDKLITNIARPGDMVDLKNYKSQTVFTLSVDQLVGSITSIRIYDKTEKQTLDYTALNKAISEAEAIDTDNYTSYSIAVLNSAVGSAKAILNDENATQEAVDIAVSKINDAISALKDKSHELNYIVKVEKSGAEAILDTFIADDSTAGAVKVKITFDCAEDVNFNKYANIEVKAVVNETESYQKIIGTGEESEAEKGETGVVVELSLNDAIAVGNDVKLSAFTWCFSNAVDYVYGITKVEYINENGVVVRTIQNVTVSLDKLKKAIDNAEEVDTSLYTDESLAELTKAIQLAKAVINNEDVTQDDVDAAVKAIDDAISGLKLLSDAGTLTGTIKVSDENAETEMTVVAISSDGAEITVTATSMGTYTLENLEAGSYTLTISGGKYADRSYEITVTEGENTQDVELNPYGDINGDGKITTADVGMANSHAKGVITLTDYGFACADVKTDGSISTADVGMINSHAKSVSTLW
jgi:Holliday junction resolvase RusA-like endonuclease